MTEFVRPIQERIEDILIVSTSKLQNFRDIRKSLCSFFATISQLIFNLRNLNQ